MSDTPIEPNYQDILDKYAASLKSTETPPIPDPESQPVAEVPPAPPQPELKPQSQPEVPIVTAPPIPPATPVEEPATPPLVSRPKENKFFKYLFFFSLIILLIVLASVVISLINSQKALENSNNAPTAALSPTTNPRDYCLLNDQRYPVNQTFTATDGCNTCTCNADLTISCTELSCIATPSVKLTPTKSATSSATQSLKTYENKTAGISFKYPSNFSYDEKIEPYYLISSKPLIKISIHAVGNPMSTNCLKSISTETNGNLQIQKYSSLSSVECGTTADTNREIWITKAGSKSEPGLIFSYSSTQIIESEKIFDQILSTFKFL